MANYNVTTYADLTNAIVTANGTTANDNIVFQGNLVLTPDQTIDLQNIPASAGIGSLRFRSQQPTPAVDPAVTYTLTVTSALNITDSNPGAQPSFAIGPFNLQIGDGTNNGSLAGNLRIDDGGIITFNNTTDSLYTGTLSVEDDGDGVFNNVAGTTVTFTGSAGTTNPTGVAIRASQSTTATTTGAANPYDLELGGAGNGVISGIIADSGLSTTANSLTKRGDGTWTFSGANTYVGTTTVADGTLLITNSQGLGAVIASDAGGTAAAAGTIVADGATLALQGGISIGAEALNLGATDVGDDDDAVAARVVAADDDDDGTPGLLNVSGNNSFAGNITLASDSIIASAAGKLTLTGAIDGAGGTDPDSGDPLTQNLTLSGDGNGSISGVIGSHVGSVTKNGDGTWALSGANTYAGGTLISEGTLELVTAASAGTGAISFDDDDQTLQIDFSGTLANEIDDFGEDDVIDLTKIAFDGASLLRNGNSLTVTEAAAYGTDSNTFNIGDAPTGMKYVLSSDGHGGTNLSLVDLDVPDTPSKPVLTTDTGASPTDGITKATTLTFVGTAEAGTTVTLFDGATALGSAIASASGTYSITLPAKKGVAALADGTHQLTAVATGPDGDASASSAASTIVIDTQAPAAPSAPALAAASDFGTLGDGVTNNATPTFTGTAEAGSTVTLYAGSKIVGTAIAGIDNTYTITSSALADGALKMKVTSTDLAGNVSAASTIASVTIDTKAPATPVAPTLAKGSDTGRSPTDGITANAAPTITGKAEAGATVNLYDTNGTTLLGTGVASSNGVYTITPTATLADGTHSLKVTATDKAGNTSAISSGRTVTIDTSVPGTPLAPQLTIASDTGRSSLDGITKITKPVVTGTAEAGSTVTLLEGTKVLGTATAGATGTYTITSSTLAQGTHALTVTATDAAGNVSTASAPKTIVIDTTAPAKPTVALANDTGLSSTDRITSDPTLVVTAEDGATVLYSTNNKTFTAVPPDFATDGSDDGAHTVYVRAVDTAGNIGATSSIKFTLVSPPQPQVVSHNTASSDFVNALFEGFFGPSSGVASTNAASQIGTLHPSVTASSADVFGHTSHAHG